MVRASPTVPSHDLVELDALRGIAITLVFALHCEGPIGGMHIYESKWGALRGFSVGGHTGVSLFFILSGFLIVRPFLAELAGGRRVSRAGYAARRALRIMPLYVSFVLLAAVANAERPADLLHAIPYLFFLQAFSGLTMPLPDYSWVWWSLATEVHFYLLLPLAVGFGRRVALVALAAALMLYAAFLAGVFPPPTLPGPGHLAHSVVGRMPLFLFGIGAAMLHRTHGTWIREKASRVRWLRSGGADLVLVGVLYALGRLLSIIARIDYQRLEVHRPVWHVIEGGLWCTVLLFVLLAPLRTRPLVVNRAWATLGLLSYSIYMVHLPFILWIVPRLQARWPVAMNGWTPMSLGAAVGIAAAVLVMATITYLAIERPMLAYKATLASRAPRHLIGTPTHR